MVVFRERRTRKAQEVRHNATVAERKLWAELRRRPLGGVKFSRQMPVGPFICDFPCREARLVVEVDRVQHAARQDANIARTSYLMREGYRVIRFWNHDVLQNADGVVTMILEALLTSTPPPAPPASGRGG